MSLDPWYKNPANRDKCGMITNFPSISPVRCEKVATMLCRIRGEVLRVCEDHLIGERLRDSIYGN